MTDLAPLRARAEDQLSRHLNLEGVPDRLAAAMRYAVMGGGKRVRPCLVYLAAGITGAALERADATACAVEFIHAYSLIHDDLPAMDDDALRRGNPTCHVAFDEATAILAGDALQALAFDIVARCEHLDVTQRMKIVERLAAAAGPAGMVAGQCIDLASEGKQISAEALVDMHRRKTGALISASLVCGAICGDADEATTGALERLGFTLGLAFQVRDDILDEVGETATIGKTAGADRDRSKSTFVSVHGVDAAQAELDRLHAESQKILAPLGPSAAPLAALVDYIARRDH